MRKMLQSVFLLLTFASLSFCFPSPLRDKTGKVLITENCGEVELDDFFGDIAQCYKEAEVPLDEAISAGQDKRLIEAALCKSIANKVECSDNLGPKCFNATEGTNYHNNYLHDQLDQAYNSSLLGPAFIRSCPILGQYQTSLAERITGSTVCSYVQYKRTERELNACRDSARDAKNYRLGLMAFVSDRRALYVNAMCTLKKDFGACLVPFYRCLGEKVKADANADHEQYFGEVEQIINNNGTDDFSFQRSCGSVSVNEKANGPLILRTS